MAAYAASNLLGGTQQAISTSFKTLVNLMADDSTALRRLSVYEFVFGTDGTPADQAMTYDVSRTTAAGTATPVTARPLDVGDGAMLGIADVNATVEPTVAAASALWSAGINQRATHRWVAFPGGELIVPAIDAAGLAFRARSPGYTGTAICQTEFNEL